jgi:formate hydrogenlyase subunit 6/NADH:ubiquinone oxidoreductase subunit I
MVTKRGYFAALKEAMHNITSKPVTVMFPKEHVELPQDYRGVPTVDESNCTVCQRCARVCPTEAIHIVETQDGKIELTVDLGRCCYCGECEAICNFSAMKLSTEWLTADFNRNDLIRNFHVEKGKKK